MRRAALALATTCFVAGAGAQGFYSHLYEPGALAVDAVIGMEVLTPGGEPLGRIGEVLFDRDTGKVASVMLDGTRIVYPIASLVSADREACVIAEPLLDAASAGATAFQATPDGLASASGLVIDLFNAAVTFPRRPPLPQAPSSATVRPGD